MLTVDQGNQAFLFIYRSISSFIRSYYPHIFVVKNRFLSDIMDSLVPLSQRNLSEARCGSMHLIGWILLFENTTFTRTYRSILTFKHSFCQTL
jgi:hypothetical protein